MELEEQPPRPTIEKLSFSRIGEMLTDVYRGHELCFRIAYHYSFPAILQFQAGLI